MFGILNKTAFSDISFCLRRFNLYYGQKKLQTIKILQIWTREKLRSTHKIIH